MGHDRFSHALLLLGLLWLGVILRWVWPPRRTATGQADDQFAKRAKTRHTKDPKRFPGLTTKPCCPVCEHAPPPAPQRPSCPPPLRSSSRGRRRPVDTSAHCCPNTHCRYHGWVGRGNIRANGHPDGGPWRQLPCIACYRYFLETHGTLFHGKRVSVDLIVRVIACLAEGLGIRGTARAFEVDPNTMLQWLVEAAPGILVDYAGSGEPIGLEITAPAHVTVEQINAVLAPLGVAGMTPEEFAPLRAA